MLLFEETYNQWSLLKMLCCCFDDVDDLYVGSEPIMCAIKAIDSILDSETWAAISTCTCHHTTTVLKHSLRQVLPVFFQAIESIVSDTHQVGVGKDLADVGDASTIEDGGLLASEHLQASDTRWVGGRFGLIWILIANGLLITL